VNVFKSKEFVQLQNYIEIGHEIPNYTKQASMQIVIRQKHD
jgi:hypothetical protein